MPKEFYILKDSREQKGWDFEPEEKKPSKCRVLGTEVIGLDAADYCIKGAEDLLRIEKKFGWCELYGNMTPLENKERFIREMEKLSKVKYKYLILEDNLSNDLLGLSIPQGYKSPPMSAVYRWIIELQIDYGIVPIFAGNAGKKAARNIIEIIAKRHL